MPPQPPFDPTSDPFLGSAEPLIFNGALLEVNGLRPIRCEAILKEEPSGERPQVPLWYFSSPEGGVKSGLVVTHEYETETNQQVFLDRTLPLLDTLKVVNSGVTDIDTGLLPVGTTGIQLLDNEIVVFRGSDHLVNLETLDLLNNPLSAIITSPAWTSLKNLNLTGPNMTSMDLKDEWVGMHSLNIQLTSLATFTLPTTWLDFRSLFFAASPVTAITLNSNLDEMSSLRLFSLPNLTSLTTHLDWGSLVSLEIRNCLTFDTLVFHPQDRKSVV